MGLTCSVSSYRAWKTDQELASALLMWNFASSCVYLALYLYYSLDQKKMPVTRSNFFFINHFLKGLP